jgi:hypothetical protein
MEMEMMVGVMMVVVFMVFVVVPAFAMYDPKPVPVMSSKTDY